MLLVAGGGLSLLVLALAFFGQAWPTWLSSPLRPGTEFAVVVGTIQDAVAEKVTPEPSPPGPAGPIGGPAATIVAGAPTAPAQTVLESSDPAPSAGPPAGALPAEREPPSAAKGSEADDARQPAPELTATEPPGILPAADVLPAAAVRDLPPVPVARPPELAAAWLARQEQQTSASGAAGAEPPVVVQAAFESPEPTGRAADDRAGLRVFVHYTAGHDDDALLARRLAAFLRLRGFEVADVIPVEMQIRSPGLRYFFARDQGDSGRLLEEVRWFFESIPEKAPDQAADFTHYHPKPRAGSIELWLPTS